MNLKKIRSEDLIFSNHAMDDRTNTYLNLYDYDCMDYSLATCFKTKDMGVLDVKFKYFGMTDATMEVEQTFNGATETITYVYATDIFEKHIVKFLEKHIRFWDEEYAFNGEEEVIAFFNDVLENGQVVNR